jgi:hypothetical protein
MTPCKEIFKSPTTYVNRKHNLFSRIHAQKYSQIHFVCRTFYKSKYFNDFWSPSVLHTYYHGHRNIYHTAKVFERLKKLSALTRKIEVCCFTMDTVFVWMMHMVNCFCKPRSKYETTCFRLINLCVVGCTHFWPPRSGPPHCLPSYSDTVYTST